MAKKVYISASTQKENIGVGQYGTEQDRMMYLADRIKFWLETQNGVFEVFRNQPNWSLYQTVDDSNAKNSDLFIDNHTNAGPSTADGTEVYYHGSSLNGRILAVKLFEQIGPLSPGSDRGVLSDTTIYKSGFYVLRETKPPAVLIEHIYHTNAVEVNHFLSNAELYARATAIGICNYFNVPWVEPKTEVEKLVDAMYERQWITDKQHWIEVLTGKQPANPEFLKIVFGRCLNA